MARFLSGASQVIITILLPVWVDAFAPSESKTTWMTLIIVAAPKGMLAGYGLSALLMTINEESALWWPFYIVILIIMIQMVILFMI